MASADDDDEWKEFSVGPSADVWMHRDCKKELEDLSPKDRAKIVATLQEWYCKLDRADQINKEKLNRDEGRHEGFQVQAFKHYQGRVYGVEGSINGKRTFFAARAVVKKDQKADPAELKRAVERIKGVPTGVSGAKVSGRV